MKNKHIPSFTPLALEQITKAAHTADLLRQDLLALNTSLTTKGLGTTTEWLAHEHLTMIMERIPQIQASLGWLQRVLETDIKNGGVK